MKNMRHIFIVGLLVVTVLVLVVVRWQATAQSQVLTQFTNTDRVVLEWGTPSSITITGDKAREIVHLVTTATCITDQKGRPQPVGILYCNQAKFYQGTNCLGIIQTSCGLFSVIGSGESYRAEKERMESLIDNPVRKRLEHQDTSPTR